MRNGGFFIVSSGDGFEPGILGGRGFESCIIFTVEDLRAVSASRINRLKLSTIQVKVEKSLQTKKMRQQEDNIFFSCQHQIVISYFIFSR